MFERMTFYLETCRGLLKRRTFTKSLMRSLRSMRAKDSGSMRGEPPGSGGRLRCCWFTFSVATGHLPSQSTLSLNQLPNNLELPRDLIYLKCLWECPTAFTCHLHRFQRETQSFPTLRFSKGRTLSFQLPTWRGGGERACGPRLPKSTTAFGRLIRLKEWKLTHRVRTVTASPSHHLLCLQVVRGTWARCASCDRAPRACCGPAQLSAPEQHLWAWGTSFVSARGRLCHMDSLGERPCVLLGKMGFFITCIFLFLPRLKNYLQNHCQDHSHHLHRARWALALRVSIFCNSNTMRIKQLLNIIVKKWSHIVEFYSWIKEPVGIKERKANAQASSKCPGHILVAMTC